MADGRSTPTRSWAASTLFGWDYLAGMLVCSEVGAVTTERDGAEIVVRDASTRRPMVAATQTLCDQLLAKSDM